MFKIVAFCCVLWKLCYFLTDRSCVIPPQISIVFGVQNSLRDWLDIKMFVSLFFTYLMSLIAPAYKLNNSAGAVSPLVSIDQCFWLNVCSYFLVETVHCHLRIHRCGTVCQCLLGMHPSDYLLLEAVRSWTDRASASLNWLRAGCRDAQLTARLGNRELTVTAWLTCGRVARSTVRASCINTFNQPLSGRIIMISMDKYRLVAMVSV